MKLILFLCLFGAFYLLFRWMSEERVLRTALRRAAASMEASARLRASEKRRNLVLMRQKRGWAFRLEQRLLFSGLALRFPLVTPEVWIAGSLTGSAAVFFGGMLLLGDWKEGMGAAGIFLAAQWAALSWLEKKNYEAVDANLLKFLDFLGNYSVTAGEVTGIFNQISRYMDEPLQSALDECYYEAQTSGDTGLALLALADKIPHPGFQELVRNIEISARYSADFKELVNSSRRAVREHLRSRQERKGMLREALVNMALLLGMSLFILAAVGQLVETDIRTLLFGTLPGRLCTAVMAGIFALFYRKTRRTV